MTDFSYQKRSYHGTRWERPLLMDDSDIEQASVYENLSCASSSLNALYTTDIEAVSQFFAENKVMDEENDLQVVIVGETRLRKPFIVEFEYGGSVMFNDTRYVIEHPDMDVDGSQKTRKDLHEALRAEGYDAFIMRGDYQHLGKPADDVAILDDSAFVPEAVKIKLGNKWSNELPIEKARAVFKKWALSPYFESSGAELEPAW